MPPKKNLIKKNLLYKNFNKGAVNSIVIQCKANNGLLKYEKK